MLDCSSEVDKQSLLKMDRQLGAKNPVIPGARNEFWPFQMTGEHRRRGGLRAQSVWDLEVFPNSALLIDCVEQSHGTHRALPCQKNPLSRRPRLISAHRTGRPCVAPAMKSLADPRLAGRLDPAAEARPVESRGLMV